MNPGSFLTAKRLKACRLKRELSGNVRVCYLVHPRPLRAGDRCAPYVDFRCENGGGTSSGNAFLADFGIYWIAEPAFDMKGIAEYTQKLFGCMQTFFRDKDCVYRIFVRKDPYTHSGGSALSRSYLFGWNDTEPVTLLNKKSILAHEMVHNWPHLADSDNEITSWYSEGGSGNHAERQTFRPTGRLF